MKNQAERLRDYAKQYCSLAEAFQRGIEPVEAPMTEHEVRYNLRIYPAINVEIPPAMQRKLEDLQQKMRSEPEKMAEYEEAVAALNLKYPLEPEIYGFTASMDYCNYSTGEMVHRTELTRPSMMELSRAMLEYVEVITDPRQRAAYQEMLEEQSGL